ncbi:GNAT family N-acetyltransferase [Bacteriovoracaceae bacterium]|nr:GNAT family N-acetyltransferase [Bacteriovoracaceae bacterium]
MEIKSLIIQTDLIFAKFAGSIEYRSDMAIIRTPSNPRFHWGNFIVFKNPPKIDDCQNWKRIFDQEFDYYKGPHHYTFVWDIDGSETSCDKEIIKAFEKYEFDYEDSIALSCSELNAPKQLNHEIKIREIKTESEWQEVIKLQILCGDEKYKKNGTYEKFKIDQFKNYRKMYEADLGFWYGAFIGETLVADLGIFHSRNLARYQSVETHPDYRNKGICGTLVYQSSLMLLKHFNIDQFVMVADPNYHAARIYENVGFKNVEKIESFSWWVR